MATLVETPAAKLSKDEVLRYSRHLIMPEVGMDGQLKLKQAKVLCIGAGGLGSPLALYLAAAGVGTLGIVDFDIVDFTNLQRQIIHDTSDVGPRNPGDASSPVPSHQSGARHPADSAGPLEGSPRPRARMVGRPGRP